MFYANKTLKAWTQSAQRKIKREHKEYLNLRELRVRILILMICVKKIMIHDNWCEFITVQS